MDLLWRQFHISHRGAFSIERLAAFDDFCHKTSVLRALLTCCLLPIPALVVVIMIELIPLRDPRDGWEANYGAWIRDFCVTFGVGIGLIVQTTELLPLLTLKLIRIFLIALITATCKTLQQIGVASAWRFPTPFGYIIGGPPFFVVLFTSMIIVARKRLLNSHFVRDLRQQILVLLIQGSFGMVYCAFCAGYYNLSPSTQPFVVLGLPTIKLTMQQAIAWATSHIQEYMAGITVFSVEVFNALFVAKAMQSAGSPLTNILLIALDIFHGVRSFHRMSKSMTQLSHTMDLGNENLVQAVLTTCQQPGIVTNTRNEIRVRSSLQHSLSVNDQSLISQIERYQATPAELNLRLDQIPSFPYHNSRKVRDAPAKSESKASSEKDAMVDTRTASLESNAQKQEFVWQALRLLFQCEYHALVEYVECMIPVVYTIYVSILCQLPSSNYQPETMNLTTARFQTMISNVLIYASWELVSLIALHVAVKRRFGLSLLHLLAFVLESRFIEFQGRLLAIFSYIFSVTLVHFGVDFTLRFKQWESRDS